MSWKSRFLSHLDQIVFFLEYQGENPFKIRAFSNAIDVLSSLEDDVLQREIHEGTLINRKGIGKGILQVAKDFLAHKKSAELDSLRGDLPESLYELRSIKGLGVKKIKALHDGLGIKTLGELEYACNENRLLSLEGFGKKTQEKIVEEIQKFKARASHYLLSDAMEYQAQILKALSPSKYEFVAVGDLAQKSEIISQFEFAIEEPDLKRAFDRLSKIASLSHFELDKKEAKIHFNIKGLPHVSIYCRNEKTIVPFEIYKTSSAQHWEALQTFAKKKNYDLTPESLSSRSKTSPKLEASTALYSALELPNYPPESRELPPDSKDKWKPLQLKQITGTFHLHTVFSDGIHTLEEMAKAAQKLGWRYFGVSDHSQTAAYARGLTEDDLEKQWDEVDSWNKKNGDSFYIFRGVESDILKDGSLDYKANTLKKFDFVIASIHSRYGMTDMSSRLLKAIENPSTTMIGHISGRLLLARDPYTFDTKKIVDAAIANKVIIEFNSNPQRLDLNWKDLASACEKGLMISINPDAHSMEGLKHIQFGVWLTNKARVPQEQILNTWPFEKVRSFFEKR